MLASNVTGMGELGNMGFSFSSVVKKVKKQIKRSAKDVGKVVKQIPHAPAKLAKQTATQIKEHKKELVGIGSAVAIPALLASGVGAPLALAIGGAGIGAATKPGEGFGKPKTWLTRAGIGAGAGFTAGSFLPAGATSFMVPAGSQGIAPAWTQVGVGSGLKLATQAGTAVKSLFSSSAAAAPAAGGAAPAAAATGMEVAPAAVSPLVAAAAPAAAGSGFSWGGLFSAVGSGLAAASQILGGKAGGVAVAPGVAPGISIDASQGGGALPSDYVGTDYGGGSAAGAGGGGGAPTEYASDEGEEITPPSAELIEKAVAGKLTPKEWAVYGAAAAGLALLAYGVYRRSRRRAAAP